MDRVLKPSLATYDIRPDRLFELPPPGLDQAQDDDEALLATVEQQAQAAAEKLRMGEPRQAITILRRAYRLAAGHASSTPGVLLPAGRLGVAAVRLQLCTVLSGVGRHAQAQSEARQAMRDMDELWKTMLGASIEAKVAVAEGDLTRPAAPLRKLLQNPPKWLQKCVEVSVQARSCLALELEYGLPAAKAARGGIAVGPGAAARADRTPKGTGRSSPAAAAAAALDCPGDQEIPAEGLPKPRLSPPEEILRLHKEAAMLATQLLPASHEVRTRAEKAQVEVVLRSEAWGTGHGAAGFGDLSGADAREGPSEEDAWEAGSFHARLPELLPLLKVGGLKRLPASAPSSPFASTQSTFFGESSSPFSSWQASSTTSWGSSQSHPSLFATRGDVFHTSLPRRSPSPQTSGARHAASRGNASGTAGGLPGSMHASEHASDPFKEWTRTVMDVNKMNLTQRKMQTDEGMHELRLALKLGNRRFKQCELKEMDSDRLFDNRTLFCNHGIKATERAKRRTGAWKQKAWQPTEESIQKRDARIELFSDYGVRLTNRNPEPDLKQMIKALKESGARTPQEVARKRREEQERRRIEEEDRRRREGETREAMRQSLGGMAGSFNKSRSSVQLEV